MTSDVVVVRVSRELKKRMKLVNINWSEEIRGFIVRRLKSLELQYALEEVGGRAKSRRVSVDSTQLIREDRELR
ncbi:MAG: hypothetical protein ACP5GU_02795 [Thermoprotei archaeon]|jgi:hypothetical protein